MYKLALSHSEVLAQDDGVVLDSTVGGVLREAAFESANTLALVEYNEKCQIGRCWSYAELLSDSEKLAIELSRVFKKGERIAVWAPNIPEWVLLEYASALAGLVVGTVAPASRAAEFGQQWGTWRSAARHSSGF